MASATPDEVEAEVPLAEPEEDAEPLLELVFAVAADVKEPPEPPPPPTDWAKMP